MAAITTLQTNDWQVALIVAAHNAATTEAQHRFSRHGDETYSERFAAIFQGLRQSVEPLMTK